MKAITTLAAAAALLALGGCDRLGIGAGSNASANAADNAAGGKDGGGGNQAAADGGKDPAGAIPAASTGGVVLDRNYIAGRWTDNDDCGNSVEFDLDGRFVAANGNEGLWNLAGDRLTMQGSSTLTLQIVPIDRDTMNVVNPDGSLGRSTRC